MISTTHEYVMWVMVLAYCIHILEEFQYNWKDWAIKTLKLDVDWSDFYLTNAVVIVVGICSGMIGWKLAPISLIFPALAFINAIFFSAFHSLTHLDLLLRLP